MSFRSYISVEVKTPDNFHEWTDEEQEQFWLCVHRAQKLAEQAYHDSIKHSLNPIAFSMDVESK